MIFFYWRVSFVFLSCISITSIWENCDCLRLLILRSAICSDYYFNLCTACLWIFYWSSNRSCSLDISNSNFSTSILCSVLSCSTKSFEQDLLIMDTRATFYFISVNSSFLLRNISIRWLYRGPGLVPVDWS